MTEYDFTDEDMETLQRCVNDPVFFAENFLYDERGHLYELEEHQKLFLRDPSQYKVLFFGRRMGKTTIATIDILHKCIFNENYRVSIVAPSKTQAENISENISDIIQRSTVVGDLFTANNVYKKRLVNGSRITLNTAGKDSVSSLIGSGTNTMLIDECQDLDDSLYAKILPIIRGQSLGSPNMIQTGTPRGREGFFYNNINNAFRIFEDGVIKQGVQNGIYSLHRKPTAFLDEDEEIVASGTNRISIKELEEDRSTMGNIEFKREYCLDFIDSLGEVYPRDLVEEATLDRIPSKFESKKPCVGGIDFGKQRNNTVLMIGELNKDKSIDIKFIKEWQLGTKYKTITDYLKNTVPKRFPNFRKLCPDATGVGQKIIEDLEDVTSYEVEPIVFTANSKIDLVESSVSKLENRDVRFIHNKRFKKEMIEYQRDLSKTNKVIYKKAESDDYVDAFVLTVEAGRTVRPPREPFALNIGSNLMNRIKGNPIVPQNRNSMRANREIRRI